MRLSGVAGIGRVTIRACLWLAAVAVVCAVGLGGAAAQSFVVPNPYASGLGDTQIAIRRLVVFGDSYSKLKRKSWHNWAEQLRYDLSNSATGKTLVSLLPSYAVSGATAATYTGSTNDLARQVTRWLGTAPKFVARDLTMLYVGYNDIKLSLDPDGDDLAGAMLAYGTQLGRIIKAGAAGSPRRIFLVMPHDWGRSPRYFGSSQAAVMRARTEVWNAYLAGLARDSSYTRLVALDQFTALECVFNQPADFGLTNVIQARPQGADAAKYLFDLNDDLHFGLRGQTLIRQVVQYYLTRGWDWSNTEKDPAKARQKLVTDLRAGKVFVGIPCDPYPTAVAAAN